MSAIDDLAGAMDRYPQDETTIEIIDVKLVNDDPNNSDTSINEEETWQFRVRLTNNGHLDMTEVSVHVAGLAGTTVREKSPDAFASGIIVGNLNPVGGGGVATSKVFQFKAPGTTQPAGTDLFHVHVQTWKAGNGFDHLFNNHTKDDNQASDLGITYPRALYSAQVFPA